MLAKLPVSHPGLALLVNFEGKGVDQHRPALVELDIVGAGIFERHARFQSPLPLSESLAIVFPQFISMIAITLVCFAISYIVFMRQEIRTV